MFRLQSHEIAACPLYRNIKKQYIQNAIKIVREAHSGNSRTIKHTHTHTKTHARTHARTHTQMHKHI